MAVDDERAMSDGAGPRTGVECLSCGRVSTLGSGGASELPLVQLTRRLRCSACGSRAVKAARIETPRDVAKLLRSRMAAGRG